LVEQKSAIQNQLHALSHSRYAMPQVVDSLNELLDKIQDLIKQTKLEIKKAIKKDKKMEMKFNKVIKIKGISHLTLATIIAETNGFVLMKNQAQLTSYAGYDVVESQSGLRVGRTKISKRGNYRIRRILHLAAINAVRYNEPRFKSLFERLYSRHGIKMKAYVAVQKKLLTTIFSLWNSDQEFNPLQTLQAVSTIVKEVAPIKIEATQDE